MNAFPPLKLALQVNDLICSLFQKLVNIICLVLRYIFLQIYRLLEFSCAKLFKLTKKIPFCWRSEEVEYVKLSHSKRVHNEPIPYRDKLFKRFLTYHVGLLLGLALYLFCYYILIKHHTYLTITVGLLLLLAYMVILENSHTIRSILMLCLPVMFTNRGRALIFCCMLTMMIAGPIKNTQFNIGELHVSLHCCKQYLLVKSDKLIEENVVKNLAQVERVVFKLIDNIRDFANELKERFKVIIQLAISVERYIMIAIEKLKEIVNVCNSHTSEVHQNCVKTFRDAYNDCKSKLGAADFLCGIVSPLEGMCTVVQLPGTLCKVPEAIMQIIDRTIGERLRQYIQIIENEFYFEVHINHTYSYQETKTKNYNQVFQEIGSDVKQKFWYIRIVSRLFNLVTLILVCWILITATLYHMHYLTEINYDNMYIDEYLQKIDSIRQDRLLKPRNANVAIDLELNDADSESSAIDYSVNDDEIDTTQVDENNNRAGSDVTGMLLFPLSPAHELQYLKPSSARMNKFEKSKFCVATFVWSAIVGYICFFMLLDFALFNILKVVDDVLKDVLFNSDLPLVDVSSKYADGHEVRYNRTYLANLRLQAKQKIKMRSELGNHTSTGSHLNDMYRKLMDAIEESVPDDVQILESLEQCLPSASKPNYKLYNNIAILALVTFGAVILEAYILRTRHCIANLYYPRRAKKRAIWLYRKMLAEKSKFDERPELLN